jgi:hypothetical protein
MHRITRLAMLVAALFTLLSLAGSTASAVTWHNTGDTAFTATGGATTLSSTGVSLSCGNAVVTGTTSAAPFVGVTWKVASGTAVYNGCTIAGVALHPTCSYAVTATSQTGGVMSGSIDVTCLTYQFGVLVCITEGTMAGTYTNPSGGVAGRPTLPTSNALRSTIAGCGLGNGDTVHTSPISFTLTNATGGPAPHTGPSITRTA